MVQFFAGGDGATCDLPGDTVRVACFTTEPDDPVSVFVGCTLPGMASIRLANEQTDTNWAAGGRALASKAYAIDAGSSSICFTAANLSGAGNVTLSNVFGCLVYDLTISGGTVNDQGLCYNYFGGLQSVVAGAFTIVWATPGGGAVSAVFNITV